MELGKLFYRIVLKGMDDFKKDVEETQIQTENSSNKMVDGFKKIGAAVAAYLTTQQIIDFGKAIVDAAATVGAEVSAFEQIMGDYSDTAQLKMNEIADATGVVSTRLTPYMTSMTAKFKGLGFDIDEATTLATEGLALASDAAAFWDKSLDESMSHLNSFINGSYEGGEAIGLFANDTQMAMYAVEQGVVGSTKEWAKLDEATKQATRLEYAKSMFEQSGATGQAAKEAGQYANVQANLTEKWRQFKAYIGEPLLQNVVIPAMEALSGVVDKLYGGYDKLTQLYQVAKEKIQELVEWYNEFKIILDLMAIMIGSVVAGMTAYQIAMAATAAATNLAAAAQAFFNSAMLSNPITWVIAGIVALVATILYLWNNCEWFREMIMTLWENIKTGFADFITFLNTSINDIITWITTNWESFKTWFQESIQAINDYITNLINSICEWVRTKTTEFITTINEMINGFINWFKTKWNDLKTWFQALLQTISTFVSTIWNGILNFIRTILNFIKTVFMTVWNAIKDTITNIITNIKNKITEIFNNIKNKISDIWNSVKTTTTNVWNDIKKGIEQPIEQAKYFVQKMIDKIKNIMNFEWKLPHLKLPRITISGEFSLIPPSAPSFGIEWFAKGGILDKPTIFGANGNNLMVGGEAGPEAIAPISELQKYLDTPNDETKNKILEALLNILNILSDDDRLKDIIIDVLINSGFKIELEGREVGRIVKEYA